MTLKEELEATKMDLERTKTDFISLASILITKGLITFTEMKGAFDVSEHLTNERLERERGVKIAGRK